ncbi:hypothetical protein L6164_011227 [Bauhinia variegata]|uniref:Uncharacterized protein n=1 Tax=Bauhinia variegata TaxID=167791 RepID=A0ACB9P7K4_BAUVA|nr:hypothetical protein L6164_011227 [Bauhinia variegata]
MSWEVGNCVLTEWDENKQLDYHNTFDDIQNPAFLFDSNILNVGKLRKIRFIVYTIGKPLDPWLQWHEIHLRP